MARVVILAEADSGDEAQQIAALKQAIDRHPVPNLTEMVVVSGQLDDVLLDDLLANETDDETDIICPLTLELPDRLHFPGQVIYQACRDVPGLRRWVAQTLDVPTGDGALWLPIVLTAKGALYAEAIASIPPERDHPTPQSFVQPLHLDDRMRQPLYRLGQQLLKSLAAPPAVYLLQFGLNQQQIWFDRLLPFPAAPALASLGVQEPDLFVCHWRCLTKQPILDIVIPASVTYRVPEEKDER